jgi:hypothetical protein
MVWLFAAEGWAQGLATSYAAVKLMTWREVMEHFRTLVMSNSKCCRRVGTACPTSKIRRCWCASLPQATTAADEIDMKRGI